LRKRNINAERPARRAHAGIIRALTPTALASEPRFDWHAEAQRQDERDRCRGATAVDGNEAAQERLEEIQAFRRERDPDLGSDGITTIVNVIISPDNPNQALLLLKMA
jgi:hypothetical protein